MRKAASSGSALHLPSRFWEQARGSSHRLLVLDYDGTLAPFRVARDEAWPLPRTVAHLEAIAATRGTGVAVISGRPLDELIRFLGTLPILLVGEHGWEMRCPDGRTAQHPLPAGAGDSLRRAMEAAEAAGLTPIKVNAVVVRDDNEEDLIDLARLTLSHPWQVRFIEMMPFAGITSFQLNNGVQEAAMRYQIQAALGPLDEMNDGELDGEARIYRLRNAPGTLGFIL